MQTSSKYFYGVMWFILSLASSTCNDIITRYSGTRLPSVEVAFFRFLFSMLTLIPFIIYYGKHHLKTQKPLVHLLRGILLFCAMTIWAQGVCRVKLATATLISFTVPLFLLILALFFLKERVIWQRWVATILGFFGVIIAIEPNSKDFDPVVLNFLIASMMFASLDIINKKYVIQETTISMLFYSALVTTVLALIPASQVWVVPTYFELFMLAILGASANLILFFLLRAFALIDATALAPYRYLELPMTTFMAYILYNEVPGISSVIGAIIVIPATLFVIYSENKNK